MPTKRKTKKATAAPEFARSYGITPNGYDARWVDCINCVLAGREETEKRIADIDEYIWDDYLGPMVDFITENIEAYE